MGHSAHLIYGVVISGVQASELKKKNSELYYRWIITADHWYTDTDQWPWVIIVKL